MEFTPPGRHKSAEEFRAHWRSVDPEMDCDLELLGAGGPLGAPLELRARTLHNRFAVHPMEGWDATDQGLPSEFTLRRWRNFGRSGAALVWGGEAYAVQADGRANPNQLYLNPDVDAVGGLARLLAEVRAGAAELGDDPEAPFVGLQLTHSGRFSRPTAQGPAPRIAYHHPVLDGRFGQADHSEPLTDGELEGIGERYVEVARQAQRVGFDFVDIKCCHGYLLHELLGARAREGPYGGSFENRTRLFRQIVAAIRSTCPGFEVGVRISLADVFPHSGDPDSGRGGPRGWDEELPFEHGFGLDADDPRRFDLTEPLRFLDLVSALDIRLVNVTLGSPYYCPHLQRPAAYPPSDGYAPPRDPLAEVAQHLEVTRRAKAAHSELVIVGTGYSYLQEYAPHVAQFEVGRGHVDLVGFGRMALSYPELPRDVLAGRPLDRKRICRTFSDCTTGPRHGLRSGCYPLDPHYRRLPEAARVKDLRDPRAAEENV